MTWLRHPPHLWQPTTLDRKALAEAAQEVQSHVAFESRAKVFAAKMLETYRATPTLNLIMREHARFAFVAFVIYLHHRQGQGEHGVTYSRLRDLFDAGKHTRAGKLATPTRIKAMLGLARLLGHVERAKIEEEHDLPRQEEPSRGTQQQQQQKQQQQRSDRRRKLLVPTSKLTLPAEEWLHAGLSAVEAWGSLLAPSARMMSTQGFLSEVVSYNVLAYIHDHFTLHEPFPRVRAFMARENGYVTVMTLLHALEDANRNATGRCVRITAAAPIEIAEQHNCSPGTIRNALAMAERSGWLRLAARGGRRIELDEAFAEECLRWGAYEIVWTTGLGNAAFQRVTSLQ